VVGLAAPNEAFTGVVDDELEVVATVGDAEVHVQPRLVPRRRR